MILLNRYDFGRAIFDALFGVKFDKSFGRVVRDATSSCGQGLYPANDHAGAVGESEQALWGDGADFLVILSDQCNIQCQQDPKTPYKQSWFSRSSRKKPANSSPKTESSSHMEKYITAPLAGQSEKGYKIHIKKKEETGMRRIRVLC